MNAMNFAGQLLERLGSRSSITDAATGEVISSRDIHRLIGSFAAHLFASGLKPGDVILIGCTLSPASSIAYLGAMYAGLVAVPIEERRLAASADALVERTRARAVWTESIDVDVTAVKVLHGHPSALATEAVPPIPREASDIAALMATSGSSETPRFVMVSHGNLTANSDAIVRSQRLENDDRAMLILPVSYCFGASVLHSNLFAGGSVVLDRRFMFPDKVLGAINQYACTNFAGVPTAYNVLLRRSKIREMPLPSLRRFLQAGGPLAPERVEEMRTITPNARFYVMYGQTEATARIACLDPPQWEKKRGSVGRPLDNLELRVIDEQENDVDTGQSGEVVVRGPSICQGYFDEPEATARVFKNGWLHTGDLGRMDADGYLWIVGRKSAFAKIRGVRVSFAEVEARVASMPGVFECGAAAVDHPEAGEALVLYIVPDGGTDGLADRVRCGLPANWTCHSVHIVAELPKTSSGKLARPALATAGSRP